jgi:transcriptional regulator with XRE-family HTH domain
MTMPPPNPTTIPAVREHFAKRLKELRIPRGFPTARSLSRALGIDENRYTRYERAEVEPDLSLLLKICGLLRASPNDLLVPSALGLNEPDGHYTAEPLAAKSPTAAVQANADPLRRRAIAWQLASEVVDAAAADNDATTVSSPLARMQRINRLFSEIESDAFGTIGRVVEDARLKALAPADAQRVTSLVEDLIAVIAAEGPSRA